MRFNCAVSLGLLCLLATTTQSLPAMVDDQPIQVEASRPRLAAFDAGSSDVAGFELTIDLRLTNRSEEFTSIPDVRVDSNEATWITFDGVLSQRPDGTWGYVVNPGLPVYPENTRYASCTSLRPGATADFSGVKTRFAMLDKRRAGLGSKPNVRLNLVLLCRQPDGKVITKILATDPFVVSLPSRPLVR